MDGGRGGVAQLGEKAQRWRGRGGGGGSKVLGHHDIKWSKKRDLIFLPV